ncbi:hypothetical protein FE257_010671 [Aspergillus nanangensis]|uniref:Sec39 domain-containing protein n=1 Tax=Aspergillus nanangensis TaxID=2582783 RepID=A0AAD4GRU9_ASPNN|nr:hypothetical protein FE257_010671 [Aspergillus nanangensis]
MAAFDSLSGAHAILLATHLCASGNVSQLPLLQSRFSRWLPLERLLRIILTYLPESTEPQSYNEVLQELCGGSSLRSEPSDLDLSSVKDLSEAVARKRVRKLRLLPLKYPEDEESDDSDLLVQFLIHRAHRIDSETGLQPLILDLLLPFYQQTPALRTWLVSSLLPLLRLNYEYYPNQDETFSLDTLESMDDNTAINVLLSMTSVENSNMDLVRNLRGLLGPWMYGSNRSKRRRLNETTQQTSISLPSQDNPPTHKTRRAAGWQTVNEWLLSRSLVDYESTVNAYVGWNGPDDVDMGGYNDENEELERDEARALRFRYGQSGLAVIYASTDTSETCLDGCFQIVMRVADLLEYDESLVPTSNNSVPSTVTFDAGHISSSSRVSLLQNSLLLAANPLTYPSESSITFLSAILLSVRALSELGHPTSCRTAANICLHSNEEVQLLELRSVIASVVKQAKYERDWRKCRQQVLWLRDWEGGPSRSEKSLSCHGLFWRVSLEIVEAEILKALLEVREYDLVVDTYVQVGSALTSAQVEAAIQEAIFTAYDNASNGNRTRGGVKRAFDILQAFQPHFPDSVSFKQIRSLIAATHALSFYSLTLQHGVPFQPVSIRVHPDPLSLIERVLEQNQKAYTKLDDLLDIGRNLVAAGFSPRPSDGEEESSDLASGAQDAVVTAERRIMSLAISSALSNDDFGTAYSYILTRLTPPSLISNSSPLTNPDIKDDITWRAVYNAGRYRASATSSTLQTQITRLSQRMELLSLALVLVPSPDPLPEILGAWRRCDEELSALRTRESEEEEIWDARGDSFSTVPGGFGPTDSEQDAFETKQQHARRARAQQSRLNLEEAPMGLFEVARGAAMALHKNAFPLQGRAGASEDSLPGESGEDAQERVRKRDVVSNMVTGGLASGIGWVLGAQPVNR